MKPMVRSRPTVMRLTRDAPGRRLGFICFAPRGRITGKSGKVRDKVRAVFRGGCEVSRAPDQAGRWRRTIPIPQPPRGGVEAGPATHYTRRHRHFRWVDPSPMISPSALAPYGHNTLPEAVIPSLPLCYRGIVRENYDLAVGTRILIATDRISAF